MNYDALYANGASEVWQRSPSKDVIIELLKQLRDENEIPRYAKVVEIGSGDGHFLNRISKEVSDEFQLFGVDLSLEATKRGTETYEHLHLFWEDGTDLPFRDCSADIVISIGSYEHFTAPCMAIEESARILFRCGFLLSMMPTLGIYRTDREDEGWYDDTGPIPQMQWNFRRHTWESFFRLSGLTLLDNEYAVQCGANKPEVFYLAYK